MIRKFLETYIQLSAAALLILVQPIKTGIQLLDITLNCGIALLILFIFAYSNRELLGFSKPQPFPLPELEPLPEPEPESEPELDLSALEWKLYDGALRVVVPDGYTIVSKDFWRIYDLMLDKLQARTTPAVIHAPSLVLRDIRRTLNFLCIPLRYSHLNDIVFEFEPDGLMSEETFKEKFGEPNN